MAMWLSDVSMTPDTSGLPGIDELTRLTNGLGAWALGLALAALVAGAALWAVGAHAQNFQQSLVGRRAVLLAGLAALLIGAAPALVNFFFHAGLRVN
jgi:MFS family permease